MKRVFEALLATVAEEIKVKGTCTSDEFIEKLATKLEVLRAMYVMYVIDLMHANGISKDDQKQFVAKYLEFSKKLGEVSSEQANEYINKK